VLNITWGITAGKSSGFEFRTLILLENSGCEMMVYWNHLCGCQKKKKKSVGSAVHFSNV
jgi:hypothetical protein